jgi:hypothetical protein
MFFREERPFVKEFVQEISENLRANGKKGLSKIQTNWLCFCLMGIIVTNTVCWAKFERASLDQRIVNAIYWMFYHAPIPWKFLLRMGVKVILRKYGITTAVGVAYDADHQQSKKTTHIHKCYKVFDKKTSGYFNGQTIVFFLLITDLITLPVDFRFYKPDPLLEAWKKEDNRLKRQGMTKKERATEPARNPEYPTKQELALQMAREFHLYYPEITLKAWLGDNHYSDAKTLNELSTLFGCQIISRLKSNQNVRDRSKNMHVTKYFRRHPPVKQQVGVRGSKVEEVFIGSARLFVPSHKKKRFVIALKYKGEEEYRYLIATDLTWRTIDIVECFTLRWLIEVFIEDFKGYEGWGQLAKQQGQNS